MFSFIFTFLICSTFLVRFFDLEKEDESIYIIFSSALAIAAAINGIFGIILTFLKCLYFPLYLLLFLMNIIFLIDNQYRLNLFLFLRKCNSELKIYWNRDDNKIYKIIFFIYIFLMILTSFGPINHSDAANVYVGYPYKFWINNQHFIDGNLNQGLLGLADFSNIFYFQDRTTWLIRVTQFLPMIPFILLSLKRQTSKIVIFVILSAPVFMQWFTLGKTNFLSESCLVLAFLVWEKNRNNSNLILLLSLIFISISFKISAILICLPFLLYLLLFYRIDLFNLKSILNKNHALIWPILLALIGLFSILLYRNYLFGNPFFPLFSNIFSTENQQLQDWEVLLKNWERSKFSIFWIFLPEKLGKISAVLGPANFLLLISTIIVLLRSLKSKIQINFVIGIFQFLILFLFAQGRADYFISPVLLSFIGMKNIDLFFIKKEIPFLRYISFSSILFQFSMFLISVFYILYIQFFTFYNYDSGMEKFAWNYYNSKVIDEKALPPILYKDSALPHLYLKKEFIPNDKFNSCFKYGSDIDNKDRFAYCVERLNIKTVIMENNPFKFDKNYNCKTESLIRVSRNIFLTEKKEVEFCAKID